jgi:hypothetical protein
MVLTELTLSVILSQLAAFIYPATECYLTFLDLGGHAAGKRMTILDQHGYKASLLLGIPPNHFS